MCMIHRFCMYIQTPLPPRVSGQIQMPNPLKICMLGWLFSHPAVELSVPIVKMIRDFCPSVPVSVGEKPFGCCPERFENCLQ